jgi:hypothetical protein
LAFARRNLGCVGLAACQTSSGSSVSLSAYFAGHITSFVKGLAAFTVNILLT